MSTLAPIAPQYMVAEPTTLIVKENRFGLTGDSANIKDTRGNVVFNVNAKLLTLSQRRHLTDPSGKILGQLRRKKAPGFHPTCYIGTSDNDKKCTVKVKGLLNLLKCDAKISIDGNDVGEVSGNWRAKSFKISINGENVASISRKTNIASLVMDADTYNVDIRPGVDAAFVTLVVIALDELYHDDD